MEDSDDWSVHGHGLGQKLKLVLFVLDTFSKLAIDKAGADWIGGDLRRARAAARTALLDEALDVLFHPADAARR